METTLPGASFTAHQLHVNSTCFSYLSFLLKTAQKDLDINDPIQHKDARFQEQAEITGFASIPGNMISKDNLC